MELRPPLLSLVYSKDENGLFRREWLHDFAYSDGAETEARLLEVVRSAQDVSLASDELQSQITDWPSEYHFTPLRANLLFPFELERFAKVLEIGCGLGAISRQLGERCGQVLSLEGSYERAQVARERTRDLNNVHVVVENFSQLETDERFDLITLIGVLEYAPGFFGGENPVQHMLQKAKGLLAPGGVLVVAIENQLGLKYFNGCSEDHAGQPYYGIHDLYSGGPFLTFGRQELARVLSAAGFQGQQFYYPFPDYKLPQFIVPEGAVEQFPELGQVAGEYTARDYSNPLHTHFFESRAWPVLAQNRLLKDLANSFLVFCTAESELTELRQSDWLAISYSGRRRKQYLSYNLFNAADGQMEVLKRSFYPIQERARWEHQLGPEPYLAGQTYFDWITDRLLKVPTAENFLDSLEPWVQSLLKQSDADAKLPASWLEHTPFNLKWDQGQLLPFDQEWGQQEPIPMDWVLVRSLLHTWQRYCVSLPFKLFPVPFETLRECINSVCDRYGIKITVERLDSVLEEEAKLQAQIIIGDHLPSIRALLDAPMRPKAPVEGLNFTQQSLVAQLAANEAERQHREQHIQQLEGARGALSAHIRQLESERQQQLQELEARTQEMHEQTRILHEHAHALHELKRSWSWRIGRKITAPNRLLKKIKRYAKDYLRPLKGIWIGCIQGSAAKEQFMAPSLRHDYAQWFAYHYALKSKDRAAIKRQIANWSHRPKISVVMPTFNTPEVWLRKVIESVQRQLYPNWELCIADDASTDPRVREILEEYAAQDERIKLIFRAENGHISASSNSALELATGEFVALLDHDDEITEDALYSVAWAIQENPEVKLIYSDEDKYTPEGFLDGFYFKPDYSPDLLYSHNFICHLGVYHTETMRQIGGFRQGFEGSQDWDLALRFLRAIDPQTETYHLPRILYHWRMIPGSTGLDISYKSYAIEAAQKAIAEDIATRHPERLFEVIPLAQIPGNFRVRYILKRKPKVSLIMPTRDGMHVLKTCVDSILAKTQYPHFELIIVDNGSENPDTLGYFEELRKHAKVRILRYEIPFNYSKLNNLAAQEATGEVLGLVNNDLEVLDGGWLEEMVSQAARPEIGCVGARLLYPNRTLQHGGVIVGLGGVAGHSHKGFPEDHPGHARRLQLVHNLSAVTAACLLLRKEVFDEVGGLDEEHLKVAFNDVDLCLKVKAAGYWNLMTPHAELFHHESATRGYEDTPEKVARFEKEKTFLSGKWGQTLAVDPFYNPNLTLDREDFSLADFPRMPKPWLDS